MIMKLDEKALEAAAKELFEVKFGWQPAIHHPGEGLLAQTQKVVGCYLAALPTADNNALREVLRLIAAGQEVDEVTGHITTFHRTTMRAMAEQALAAPEERVG